MAGFNINLIDVLESDQLKSDDLILLTRPSTTQNFNVPSSVFQTVSQFNAFQSANSTLISTLSTTLASRISALQTNLGIVNLNIPTNFIKHPQIANNAETVGPLLYNKNSGVLSALSLQTFLNAVLPSISDNNVLTKSNGVWQGSPYVASSVTDEINNIKNQTASLSSLLQGLDSYTKNLLNSSLFSTLNALDTRINSAVTSLSALNNSLTSRINSVETQLNAFKQLIEDKNLDDKILSLSLRCGNLQNQINGIENLVNVRINAATSTINQMVPVGIVLYYAGVTAPLGWLFCDGSLVRKVDYPDLFELMKTWIINVKGLGFFDASGNEILSPNTFLDNSNPNFRLPDLRGQFIRGWDSGKGIDLQRLFGSFQSDEIKSHKHTLPGRTRAGAWDGEGVFYQDANSENYTIDKMRSTGGVETRPRNVALLPIIKAKNI